MQEQEVVNEKVVEATEVESTPTEEVTEAPSGEEVAAEPTDTQTDDESEAQVGELTESEKKVSESVPYERFSQVNEEKKAAEERAAYLEQMMQEKDRPQQRDIPIMEEDARLAVDSRVNEIYEAREEAKFRRANESELKDPVIEGVYNQLVNKKIKSNVPYIDREETLKEAKELIDSRLTRASKEAKNEGVKEGQKLAENKQQNAPVGESKANDKIDESQLSASDMVKYYNIPRVN